MESTICGICGKSAFEDVAAPVIRERQKSWTTLVEQGDLKKVSIVLGLLLLVAVAAVFVLTRPDATVTATELPPPDPDAFPVQEHVEPQDPAPPSVDSATCEGDIITPRAPREVTDGLSPWETAPPVDFVTGQFLDEDLDYSIDIERVAELLDAFPVELNLVALDPPEILTFDGIVDSDMLEETQPFAARTLQREDGLDVGELWLIASGGSAIGDEYLAAARARWNVEAGIEQFAPSSGLRIWQLGDGDSPAVWATDLEADSLLIVQAPVLVSPETITDTLRAWRRSIVAQDGR